MWPYWLMFFVAAYFAVTRLRLVSLSAQLRHWTVSWWLMFILLTLMIGLRHEVGGDWNGYMNRINGYVDVPLSDVISLADLAYNFLSWIGSRWGHIYFVNTICAILFAWGLLTFCRVQPCPWLAVLVAIPYLVIVVAMGYSRQGVAIGLAMLGIVALGEGRILGFLGWVGFAALFHRSALILIPLAALSSAKRKSWVAIWVAMSAGLFLILLVQESLVLLDSDLLKREAHYLEAEYQSSGAAVRIAMNALPAIIFLLLRGRFSLPKAQQSFWTWMAGGALVFIVLLIVSPSSSAVDRLALYWIPLQVFVWSRLPSVLSYPKGYRLIWIFLVVGYSATVQLVWLEFSDSPYLWLPYKSYLFE